jgi:Ser/Thr protein kinase RdoA (MazF antagonist)
VCQRYCAAAGFGPVRHAFVTNGMTATEHWTRPEWLAEARAWVEARLAERGTEIAGEIEQPHVYWWATALRIPTTDGVVWFKAEQPHHAFEVALTELLARLAPRHTAEVVGSDRARGWMLTRDAGTRLRELPDALAHWEALLPRYAEIQIELASRVDELLALGVADHSLAAMPEQLRRALDDDAALLLGRDDGLTADERRRIVDELPAFDELCRRLLEIPIPETLQHDDLHDANVFVRDGEYVVFDWGDSCISHPFHTLAVTLRAVAYRLELPAGGREVLRLRDAYVEPWTRVAPRADAEFAIDLARRTGAIQRALAWHRFSQLMPADARADTISSVPYGIKLYLADAPWGTWEV